MEHVLEIRQTEHGKKGALALTGEVTVAWARQTRHALLEALAAVDILILDLYGIEVVDLSFLQMLCALHRESFLLDKKIILKGEDTRIINDIVTKAGYLKTKGCRSDIGESCPWAFSAAKTCGG